LSTPFQRPPNAKPLHSLVRRQIRRCFPEDHSFSPEGLGFVEAVNEVYHQVDADRLMLERSLHLSSQELLAANDELRSILRAVEATAGSIGAAFFEQLVRQLCRALDVDFAALSELCDGANRARTVAWCERDEVRGNIEFEIAGTGLDEAMQGDLTSWPKGQSHALPSHLWLAEHGIVAKMELLLRDSGGAPLGFLGISSRGPIRRAALAKAMLRIFAMRATAELERRRAEQRLRVMEARLQVSDRMASLGTLAAGVGHEINNPLSYVLANLTVIADSFSAVGPLGPLERADLEGAVKEAQHGAERVRQIVRDLKTFSRHGDDERRVSVDLRRVMKSALRMAQYELRYRARIVESFHATPTVSANEGRLGQVFLNLLVNAAHAVPEGDVDANEVRIRTFTRTDGFAVAEVEDTGMGISPDIARRVFDPFFTTKPQGAGTGLGLSICHSIVTSYGGEITFDSEVGRGTTFRVSLPPATVARKDPAAAATRVGGPSARILIVDDEPFVGAALRRLLREHDVTVVSSALEAIEALSKGARYELILCDLMMREMSGMEFHAALERAMPEDVHRVIFMTGGAFTPEAKSFLERESIVHLEKPIEASQVRAILLNRAREPAPAVSKG
jgi:signal transduction histidine kinase/ActR/RegA family two-component response regulator